MYIVTVVMITAMLGKLEVFWDVLPYLLIHTDVLEECSAFTTLVTVCQSTQYDVQEDFSLHQCHYENFKPCNRVGRSESGSQALSEEIWQHDFCHPNPLPKTCQRQNDTKNHVRF